MHVSLHDTDLRALVSDAFHLALSEAIEPSITHIAPINTMGCFLLRYLTEKEYAPVCGSVEVQHGLARLSLEADVRQVRDHQYYLWIECPDHEGNVELVDFGARYWKAWAAQEDQLWLDDAPGALWDYKHRIDPAYARYTPDIEVTRIVTEALNQAASSETPDPSLELWERTVNRTVDHMMSTRLGLSFLVERGLAEPTE